MATLCRLDELENAVTRPRGYRRLVTAQAFSQLVPSGFEPMNARLLNQPIERTRRGALHDRNE
jgi:hypothetical protein